LQLGSLIDETFGNEVRFTCKGGKAMNVLLAYDGSESADQSLLDLQKAGLPPAAHVRVLSVVEHWLPPPSALEVVEQLDYDKEYQALAQRGAARLRELQPTWQVEASTRAGAPAATIIEAAEEWKADLIVLSSHGRSALGRVFFGSVSQKVLHAAHCAVRVARGRLAEPGTPLRLIAGVDGSTGAAHAVTSLAERVWPPGTEVRVVQAAWPFPPAMPNHALGPVTQWIIAENARNKAAVEAALDQLKAAGLKAETVIKEEEPKKLLCGEAEAWDADCIFVGAHGHGRIERFLIGSVSSSVAARAHCSVEVWR
jgi:nucleotide-binding universal stress UspA family protein